MDKNVLHNDANIILTLLIEQDEAQLEIQSTKNGPALLSPDDVIVVLEGQGVPVQLVDRAHALADLGDLSRFGADGFNLMVRVDEFFAGWDINSEQ